MGMTLGIIIGLTIVTLLTILGVETAREFFLMHKHPEPFSESDNKSVSERVMGGGGIKG